MKLLYPLVAALLGLSGSCLAQGTSIGTTQGSTREAGTAAGNPTSEEAASTAPAAGPVRGDRLPITEGQGASAGATSRLSGPCARLSGLDREKCLREARGATGTGGTASGLGGSPDRVGPGSTGMGR